jgi:uncharacterized membrane protein
MSIPPNFGEYTSQSPLGDPSAITQDDKTMAMLSYILGIFTGFLWLVKKDQSKFVAFHALQALILHAVVVAGYILSGFLLFVLIGFLTYPAFFIIGLVYSLLAGLAANKGDWYEIPIVGKLARQQVGL